MTNKALAQLRRDTTQAQQHLAFLERCAALDPASQPHSILLATPDMLAVARAVAYLLAADIVAGPLPIRLREINQPVLITRNWCSRPHPRPLTGFVASFHRR